jgi:hypothetical protein
MIRMSRSQYRVYNWLLGRTNFCREVKCSARKISLEFNWSDQYAAKILDQLEEKNILFLLKRGTGQRPNKYRLEKFLPGSILVSRVKRIRIPKLPAGDTLTSSQNQPNSLSASSRAYTRIPGESLIHPSIDLRSMELTLGLNINNARADNAREERRKIFTFELPQFVVGTPKSVRSPFNRFEKKKYNPESWNAQDVVCYYALLYKFIFGTFPRIDWKRDCGAARNLLNWFVKDDKPDPTQVKLFLQIAFGLSKRDWVIGSLAWFTQEWVINMVVQRRDARPLLANQAASQYEDRLVLAL